MRPSGGSDRTGRDRNVVPAALTGPHDGHPAASQEGKLSPGRPAPRRAVVPIRLLIGPRSVASCPGGGSNRAQRLAPSKFGWTPPSNVAILIGGSAPGEILPHSLPREPATFLGTVTLNHTECGASGWVGHKTTRDGTSHAGSAVLRTRARRGPSATSGERSPGRPSPSHASAPGARPPG
jgi:hypothetical protein